MRPFFAALLVALAIPCRADVIGDFENRVRSEYLKPFALDLGGVLGAASVDTGRAWGFPGFEAGLVSGLQFRPDRDDRIMRDSNVKAFGVPMLQLGVGLPFKTGVVLHGLKAGGVGVVGGGVRWSLFEAPAVGQALPTAGVSFFYDRITHDAFSGDHYAGNVSVGWALPLITPFANAGFDVTRVKVESAAVASLRGQSAWARGARFAAGADLTPFPFFRLRAAYQILHGIPGATLGLLFKF